MKAMIPTLRNFFPLGQFLGFSSSSFEKSTICAGINFVSSQKESPEQSLPLHLYPRGHWPGRCVAAVTAHHFPPPCRADLCIEHKVLMHVP